MSETNNTHFLTRISASFNLIVVLGLFLSFLSTHISPEKLPWLSLFGISFPIWLALNLLFTAYWFLRRKKYFFLSFIILLLGASHITDFLQLSFSTTPTSENDSFRILSYNVRLFGLYTWTENKTIRDKMIKQLIEEDADIMTFQEFYFTERRDGFQTKTILEEKFKGSFFHEKYTHELIHSQYFGVATLSKFPIVAKGYIEFYNDRNNFCIYSDIKIKQDTIRVFNGHFASIRFKEEDYAYIEELKEDAKHIDPEKITGITKRLTSATVKRASQVEKVMEEVLRSPYPVVLTGDFNDAPVSYAYQTVKQHLTDSFTESGNGIGNTYIGSFPSFRIDYIFHDENFSAHKYKTLPEKYSDHYAITTILQFERH